MVALCATISFTAVVFFAGIAAACEGGGGGTCTQAPSVTTSSASGITYYSAYLNGQVDPHGCQTSYTFEIKKNGNWIGNEPHNLLSETSPESVSEWEPFLESKTTYEFRLKATSSGGTNTGSAKSFTTQAEPPPPPTKPSVTTEAASEITSDGAKLNGLVNPNGSSTNYKFEYGTSKEVFTYSTPSVNIGTTSQKVSANVNLAPGTVYYFRLSATNGGGTKAGGELNFTTSAALWKIKETSNPGTSGSYLNDVSCEPSTSVCTAVGKSTSSGADSPVAVRWNGTAWSEQSAAKKSGATHTRLVGVDCPSETRCLAVGNHQSSEGPSVLSEIWNEAKWSVQTTPLPTESTASEFTAIGCNSTANCTAVGSATIGGGKKAIAERWTSPTWALSTIPTPEGAESSQLDGVDCLWSNFCVAVGRYTTSGGQIKSLVEFWNGTEWSLQTAADPGEAEESYLLDVSCTPTPNRCTAVGAWRKKGGELLTLAYRFNGVTTWTLQTTPSHSGGFGSIFEEVSCASETSCTAVGDWIESFGSIKTLAAAWNGSSWSSQGTTNPSGGLYSKLMGVSCRGSSCMAVGWSLKESGGFTTLSEFRE